MTLISRNLTYFKKSVRAVSLCLMRIPDGLTIYSTMPFSMILSNLNCTCLFVR
jgi:hypothetical protein